MIQGSERQDDGQSADSSPSNRRTSAAARPQSIDDTAIEHRLKPREIRRFIAAEIERAGHGEEPFDADLERIGVRARRKKRKGKITYEVYDPTLLVHALRLSKDVRLSTHEAETLARVLQDFSLLLQGKDPEACQIFVMRAKKWEFYRPSERYLADVEWAAERFAPWLSDDAGDESP